MNYIRHLNAFLEKAEGDDMFTPHHRSLYMTLFRMWNKTGFKPTFSINRDEVMGKAHIGSKTTYYQCLKDLIKAEYLQYDKPNPKCLHAMVTMKALCRPENEPVPVPEIGQVHPENETAPVPEEGHSIKQVSKVLSNSPSKPEAAIIGPTLEEVHLFFQQYECHPIAPTNFWHRYSTANWHCGGTPIQDWKSLARTWLSNQTFFKQKNPPDEYPDTNTAPNYNQSF